MLELLEFLRLLELLSMSSELFYNFWVPSDIKQLIDHFVAGNLQMFLMLPCNRDFEKISCTSDLLINLSVQVNHRFDVIIDV